MTRTLPRQLLPACYDALCHASAKPRIVIHAAYRKWQHAAPAEPCRWGKEKPIAIDCRCPGCVESLCFLYFDTVASKFAAPLTPHTKGFAR